MTPAELARAIEQHRFPPLLLLYGEDTFSLERSLLRLLRAALPDEARDFNFAQLQGREVRATAVVDAAWTLPVFAPRRLVLLKDVQQIPAAELDALLPYLADPSPDTLLILVADKVDGRRKFFVEFKKRGVLVEYKRPYDNQIPALVRELAREEGLTFTEDGLALFCRRVSADLQEIHAEIVKLSAYLGGATLADLGDVAAVVSVSRSESVFDLTDALGSQDLPRALRLLGALLDDGTAPLQLLALMARHFRQLWRLRELLERGAGKAEMQREIGINPYFLEGLLTQARRFPPQRYGQVFEALLETDLALKSSGAHPSALMEVLLYRIAGRAAQ